MCNTFKLQLIKWQWPIATDEWIHFLQRDNYQTWTMGEFDSETLGFNSLDG